MTLTGYFGDGAMVWQVDLCPASSTGSAGVGRTALPGRAVVSSLAHVSDATDRG